MQNARNEKTPNGTPPAPLTAEDVAALKRTADEADAAVERAQAAEDEAAGHPDEAVLERAVIAARVAEKRAQHARRLHAEAAAIFDAQEQARARQAYEDAQRDVQQFLTVTCRDVVAKLAANERERRALLRGEAFGLVLAQNELREGMPALFAKVQRTAGEPRNVACMQMPPATPADVLAYALHLVAREAEEADREAYRVDAEARHAAELARAAAEPSHTAAAVHACRVASDEMANAEAALREAERHAQRHQMDGESQAARARAFERHANARRALAAANERLSVVRTPLQLPPEVA